MDERAGPNRRELLATAAGGALVVHGAAAGMADPPGASAGLPTVKPEDIGLDPKQLKVAYDLIEARDAAGGNDTQIVRVEQLYPFPGDAIAERVAKMPNLEEIVWAQEEPKNNGYWFFVEPLIEEALASVNSPVKRARYAGRSASASPATGLMKRHQAEQGALVADALGHSVRDEIRRTRAS